MRLAVVKQKRSASGPGAAHVLCNVGFERREGLTVSGVEADDVHRNNLESILLEDHLGGSEGDDRQSMKR